MSLTERSISALHDAMVRRLVEEGQVRTRRIEDAFRAVPRHLFLPGVSPEFVYSGEAIITRRGADGNPTSSSSMPAIMAVMLEQLDVQPGHRVLEIGAGTGYNAALLARLTGPEGAVTTIDIDDEIVREARHRLDAAGCPAVRTVRGDGWLGVPEHAPYDRIEATVGIWDVSPSWVAQLVDGGIVVVPLWLGPGAELSVAFLKDGERLRSVTVEPCGFMRLRGPHASQEGYVCVHGWTVSLDDPSPECVSVLAALLRVEPRVEPAPPVPPGWCMRLSLEEPRAVFLNRQDNWRDGGCGVLDIAGRSLAALRGWQLQTFGGDAARSILLGRLIGGRPLDTRTLTIEAVPSTVPPLSGVGRVIPRPHFQFSIRERIASK
jgi:protein-L-isoaspartate(D-aspartate) O-methyltransferase